MPRYRSLLTLILVIVATFLISCSGPTATTVPETYTTAQVEQIQQYIPDIVDFRDRMSELPKLIQRNNWIDVNNFIHGPLGEMRLKMTYVSRHLLPKDQERARQATRDLFNDLVKLEEAAQDKNSQRAVLNYREALSDINNFLQVVPTESSKA